MKFLRDLFRYEPCTGGTWELMLCRLLLVYVILFPFDLGIFQNGNGFFIDLTYTTQRAPNGLAQWFDFTFMGDAETRAILKGIFKVACIAYILGIGSIPALGVMAFVMVSQGTLRNSQGNVHHGTQLICLVVCGQFLANLALGVYERYKREPFSIFTSLWRQRIVFFVTLQVIAAPYVVAGIWKLHRSGLEWFLNLPNMAVYVDRNAWQHFQAGGGLEELERGQALAQLILDHPILSILFIGPGLFAELFAFLAPLNRRMAFLFGVGLIAFHKIVGYVMQLTFPLNEAVLLIFYINVPFLIVWTVGRVAGFFRGGGATRAPLPEDAAGDPPGA